VNIASIDLVEDASVDEPGDGVGGPRLRRTPPLFGMVGLSAGIVTALPPAAFAGGTNDALTEYTTASGLNGLPTAITAGPDGNVWFTESTSGSNKIGRITPSGTVTEFATPSSSSAPWGITTGPDGNIWFTENSSGKIGTLALSIGA
jgi:streptogramin lyase